MARPKKATVDYFSHDVNHGKTLTVLEDRFGNDGYAFWFKLLEALGRTDGHCLDCSDPAEWAFLASRAHVTKERAEEIMQSLEELGAIDRELWKHDRKVWCQNLVERLDDVYKRRQTETPCKPVSAYINPADHMFPQTETDKVNKRKGKESSTRKQFSIPSVDQCREYAVAISIPANEGDAFHDHFTARDWRFKDGKKMCDWQASMRTWKRNMNAFGKGEIPKPKRELPNLADVFHD